MTQKLKTKIAQKRQRRKQKLWTKKQNQSHEYQTKREEFNNQDIQIQKNIVKFMDNHYKIIFIVKCRDKDKWIIYVDW